MTLTPLVPPARCLFYCFPSLHPSRNLSVKCPPGSRDQPPRYLRCLCGGLWGLRSGLPEVARVGLGPTQDCGRPASGGARSLLNSLLTESSSSGNPWPCGLGSPPSIRTSLPSAGLVRPPKRAASSTVPWPVTLVTRVAAHAKSV